MALGEVLRTSLLDRLERSAPAIIAFAAPAGFGKSTLMRQLMARRNGRICDCADLRDDLDLARRLLPERAGELDDGGASVAERLERALVAWAGVSGTVAFENAEQIDAASGARAFFKRLLAGRPRTATLLICGRDSARMKLTPYAAPHEIVLLRARDLAFDEDEIASALGPSAHADGGVARVAEVSRGWPVAVFSLVKGAASAELHDYITDEILMGLDPRVVQALFACASIPRATVADLRTAFGDPVLVDQLGEFAKESPFVTRESDGAFVVHPLIAAALIEHQEERRAALLREVAAAREAGGEFERAAQIHAARSDQHATARALARHEVLGDRSPSAIYVTTLQGLDRAIVARYPRLWGMRALSRLFCEDMERLLDEAESMWRTIAPHASPMERLYIVLFRVVFASYAGPLKDALDVLEVFVQNAGAADPPHSLLDAYVIYLRALLRARMGAFNEAEAALNVAFGLIGDVDMVATSMYMCFGADIARARGERAIEAQFIDRALDRALASGMENMQAVVYMQMLIGAWLGGDMARFAKAAEGLEVIRERRRVVGFDFLTKVARGGRVEPSSTDVPRGIVYGRLIGLSAVRDASERQRMAESAFSLAARLGQPFLETLTSIALGLCDELRFAECLDAAREAAERCESPELLRSVAAIRERRSDVGMLGAFVAQLERGRTYAPAPIAVDVTVGRVRVDGAPVNLGGRELELALALALRREPTSRARLSAMLWPDLEEAAARNALSVCLHRLRAHLKRADAIVREAGGYRLHDDASVDLWEIERTAARLRSREDLSDSDRAALERTWLRLREERPARMDQWEWFEGTRRRLDALRVDISHRLALGALERGETGKALQFAHDAIALDGCDEPAFEVVIRAHIRDGDRSAALRAFRQYRDALRNELGIEPSESLATLVAG